MIEPQCVRICISVMARDEDDASESTQTHISEYMFKLWIINVTQLMYQCLIGRSKLQTIRNMRYIHFITGQPNWMQILELYEL